ncbi:MAG: hypothetical protein ACRBF0_12930 [Calditrichia bacterium]
MLNVANSILRKELKGGEEIIWWGQPNGEDGSRFWLRTYDLLKRIAAFLLLIAAVIFYLGMIDLNYQNWRGPFSMDGVRKVLDYGAVFLLAGLLALIFRSIIPNFMHDRVRTIYAVTNKNIMIINKEGKKAPKVDRFRVGEVRRPSLEKTPNKTFNVLFSDTADKSGGFRTRIDWAGFYDIVDGKGAEQAIAKWRKERLKGGPKSRTAMRSKQLGLELNLPGDWSSQTLFLPPEERDNLMFAMIGATLDGFTNFMTGLSSDSIWNTIIINRKGNAGSKNDRAGVDYYSIAVQGVLTDKKLTEKTDLKHVTPKKFQTYVENANEGVDALNDSLLICRLFHLFDKDKKKIRINGRANPLKQLNDEKKGWNCFQLEGGIRITGMMEIIIRQLYLFKDGVHLRIIAMGPGPEKEKSFGQTKEVMLDIAKSVTLLADQITLKDEPPAKPKPSGKKQQNVKEKPPAKKEKPVEEKKPKEEAEKAEAPKEKAQEPKTKNGPEIIQY